MACLVIALPVFYCIVFLFPPFLLVQNGNNYICAKIWDEYEDKQERLQLNLQLFDKTKWTNKPRAFLFVLKTT